MMLHIQPVYNVHPSLVLGQAPLPTRAQVLGVIKHPRDGGWGALVRLANGTYVHMVAGLTRSLPQKEAAEVAAKLAN
jgi:hypothetical protein